MYRIAFLLLLVVASVARAEDGATTDLPILAEPEWLATGIHAQAIERQNASQDERNTQTMLLLDVRTDESLRSEKPPGAITIDPAEWKQAVGNGDDIQAWTQRIGEVLKNPEATVVVIDQEFTPTAARIWWILKYWGVKDVRVLNGGFEAYKDAKGVIVTGEQGPTDSPSEFQAEPQADRLATYEQVQGVASEAGATCLVDTRSGEENDAGYIPTARHLDWQDLVDPQTGKLRSKEELAKLLSRIRFDPSSKTITYCRSGGRASVTAFAIEHVTGKPVANYYGSWSDWRKRGGPAKVGVAEPSVENEP